MPVVTESVPRLVHVSLFLFFFSLGDWHLALNTIIGIATAVPNQRLWFDLHFQHVRSPNPFPKIILRPDLVLGTEGASTYLDRACGGVFRVVSSNMSKGWTQLAMEENAKVAM